MANQDMSLSYSQQLVIGIVRESARLNNFLNWERVICSEEVVASSIYT
jgi:hypothetical protein